MRRLHVAQKVRDRRGLVNECAVEKEQAMDHPVDAYSRRKSLSGRGLERELTVLPNH